MLKNDGNFFGRWKIQDGKTRNNMKMEKVKTREGTFGMEKQMDENALKLLDASGKSNTFRKNGRNGKE